ncbi:MULTISPECIES: cupin domain-containing protein [Mesorhizobium]|uniref:Quercetin dioxygenase-like cupin family protein n=1 Tax=Mesorhizobium shonense TaxID=1209948 RepID=A0ABV2HP88_9HYPH|nr:MULTISPECIES: cupin [unclassified Mesorhizobium]AZO28946.1 cupin [Mesorhizobium sp. M1B.F.Ca.ET.045.04.1.1]RWB21333.1 MAG: cupin [Mesorhizobium sp.]RWE01884.1 MAG: cupin [Mesorhizobium sp.]TIS50903.1 MAG: cupin [Mesorhizobium sp.]
MASKTVALRVPLKLALTLGLLTATAAFSVAPVFAGDCPAGQAATTDIQEHPSKPVGVTDTVLSAIDLSSKGEAWKGNMLRLRKLVVQPGGVVPWHEHTIRPANIIVVEGSITEYASTCKVGIEHPAGDVTAEFGHLAHWWKNNGKVPAVLYSADILPPAMHNDHMM